MGFKDFSKSTNNQEKDIQAESKKAQKLYNEYKDLSQDELIAELYKHVAKQKQNGTFDYNSLCKMLGEVSPFLTEEQKQKMEQILKDLK